MDIFLVPPSNVAGLVPALLPYLKESEERTRGRALAEDLVDMVLAGRMQLWVVEKEAIPYGHIITEIKEYPRCKMLTVQYCAMKPWTMDIVSEKMHSIAERFAKDAGCAGVEFVGRPGWRNVAKENGYEIQSVMYQKFFKEAEHGPVKH